MHTVVPAFDLGAGASTFAIELSSWSLVLAVGIVRTAFYILKVFLYVKSSS